MTNQEIYAFNKAKGQELKPNVQWAFNAWVDSCWKANKLFRVTEALRSTSRQHTLWLQGRTTEGSIVTYEDGYSHPSMHQLGLAVDVCPLNTSYSDLASLAAPFGITHPFPNVKDATFTDQPHFQFDQVGPKPPDSIVADPLHLSPDAQMKAFAHGIARIPDPDAKARAVQRFIKEYGKDPLTLV